MITVTPQAKHDQKLVGIWIRVSTEDQAQGESPEHHKHRAEMYAESKGWKVGRVYDLSGVSGKSVVDHPEAQAMLRDIKAGKISGLIFSKLARLARNTRELLDFADYFQQNNADLISLAESIDTSTPAGRFFYTLIAALAQWEREEIVSRVKASVQVRAKMGKSLGGAAPFGYRRDGQKLVLDDAEAPIRRMIFDLFLEHKRLKTVARVLNEGGYRTRSGQKFSDTTVRRLLEDPLAKGQRRSNYTESTGNGKHWSLKSPEEWIFSEAPGLVSAEVWDAVNTLLNKRKDGEAPRKRAVHLFTGLARCDCGGAFTVLWKSPNYTCRKCRRKIGIKDLEIVFRDQLRGFFLSADEVRKYLEAGDSALAQKRQVLAVLDAERAQVRSDMDKTYQLYLAGTISPAGFGERYGPLEARMAQLMEEIPRLQGETDFLAVQHLSSEEIVAEAQDLYGRWDELQSDEKRRVVESVVQRITISEESVVIDLYYTPDFSPEPRSVGSHGSAVKSGNGTPVRHDSPSLTPQTAANRQRNYTDSSRPRG